MARGIRLPMKAKNGRLVMLGGDAYIEQLIFAALGNNDSENPFQDIGLGEFMIFGINDRLTEGQIRKRVVAAFDTLRRDQLATLEELTFESVEEEKMMVIGYRNLETGKREAVEVPIPPAE